MAIPPEDIAAFLAANVPGLEVGANLFAGPVRAATLEGDVIIPHAAVFVDVEDGGEMAPYLGVRSSDRLATLAVTVRGNPGEVKATAERAASLLEVLHLANVPGYYSCVAQDAFPEHLGKDDAGCHEYEFAVEVRWVG